MAEIYSVERIFAFPKSVNCLRFGPLGDLLAIGGDDGVVTLIDFVLGTTKFRWVAVAPVTALHWQAPTILFAGYGDGSIARLDVAMTDGDHVRLFMGYIWPSVLTSCSHRLHRDVRILLVLRELLSISTTTRTLGVSPLLWRKAS